MTNEEAKKFIAQSVKSDVDMALVADAIKALEQEPCDDCISRQAVLDGLASIAKAKAKSDAQKALMGRVMFFTEQLPPVTPQQKIGHWIPVSERLPEKPYGCIITVMDTNPMTCDEFENIYPGFVGWDGENWNDADGNSISFEVIAWQPLPEPYKAESEG